MEAWVALLTGTRAAVARRGHGGDAAENARAKAALAMLEEGAWAVYEVSVQAKLIGAARQAAQLAAEEVRVRAVELTRAYSPAEHAAISSRRKRRDAAVAAAAAACVTRR